MINIILKNKNLIKLYKYGKIIFKFLNKHFYLLSIISYIARLRNSMYYKVISWVLKLVLIINLCITSGLMFSVLDLTTPLNVVYEFYNNLLSPYIDMITSKYEEISNLNPKIETEYSNKFKVVNKEIINNDPTVEINETNRYNYIRWLLFGAAVGIFLYVTFIVPGPSIDPGEINNYNAINRFFINSKIYIKDLFNAVNVIHNAGPVIDTVNTGGQGPEGAIIFDADIPLSPVSDSGSTVTQSPVASTSTVAETLDKGKEVASITPLTAEASTQTYLEAKTVSQLIEFREVICNALDTNEATEIKNKINKTIKTITD
jgi:hypothetical protein